MRRVARFMSRPAQAGGIGTRVGINIARNGRHQTCGPAMMLPNPARRSGSSAKTTISMMPLELMTEPRTLQDFLGVWTLSRTIVHADGTTGRFDGTATWTPRRDGADYLETGTLNMNSASFQATRRHIWHGLDVHFEDGRFFHSVPAFGGETMHWCAPDTYRATYDFRAWPRFEAIWQVSGPKKDYTMRSTFTRACA